MLDKIKENIKIFRLPLILIGVFLILFLVINIILPVVNSVTANKTPIVSISATCDETYEVGDEIKAKDIEVTAEHENGKTTSVDTDDFTLSSDELNITGAVTVVTVSLKEDESISCKLKVNVEREEVESFYCGTPTLKDVKAVIYSNGELCFEGEGDIMQFSDSVPWSGYSDADGDNAIIAVTFEEGVTPTSLDGFFEGLEALTYVENIPSSVESMEGTFYGCTALVEAPELTQCTNLLNMTETYYNCTALETIPALPASVKNTTNMCTGCTALQTTAEMENTSITDATAMYSDCTTLTTVTALPATLKDMDYMFSGCINLKDMPVIPDSVTSMERTFEGDISLKTAQTIPSGVTNVSGCFYECSILSGTLTVNGDPESYNSFLSGAAVATDLDLQGSSTILNKLALAGTDNPNITVNGAEAVSD